ncbi:hypothetical protein P4310_21875 [Bacillus thuringiensis]|nr:hypothetical protein [Bacillus thuringiensis]
MAYKILSGAAVEFGLDEIGTHKLSKTYGYHMYMQMKNIALLMEIFNQSSEKVTLLYIGLKFNHYFFFLNLYSYSCISYCITQKRKSN